MTQGTPAEWIPQLTELTVQLCAKVAERLAYWSRDLPTHERNRIMDMIEGQLPTVVANSIAKTASVHSAAGVEYLAQNLDDWAETWAKKFIARD